MNTVYQTVNVSLLINGLKHDVKTLWEVASEQILYAEYAEKGKPRARTFFFSEYAIAVFSYTNIIKNLQTLETCSC